MRECRNFLRSTKTKLRSETTHRKSSTIGTKCLDLGSAICGISDRRFQRDIRNVLSSMSFTKSPELEKLLFAILIAEIRQ